MFKVSIDSVYFTQQCLSFSVPALATCFTLTDSTCTFLNYELLYTGKFSHHFIFPNFANFCCPRGSFVKILKKNKYRLLTEVEVSMGFINRATQSRG